MILTSYDCRKTHSIGIFVCASVYRYTTGVFLGHYFQEEIANDNAVSGAFAVIGELYIDMEKPQPRGR